MPLIIWGYGGGGGGEGEGRVLYIYDSGYRASEVSCTLYAELEFVEYHTYNDLFRPECVLQDW